MFKSTRRAARARVAALSALALTGTWAAQAQTYAIEFVDSPASGSRMNASGAIVGAWTTWPCADHQCVPQSHVGVWRAEGRVELPTLPGYTASPAAIAADGLVVGSLSDFLGPARAAVWQFAGGAYQVTDLGVLPGMTRAQVVGIDAAGRVVGSSSGNLGWKPFVWTATTGMVDLTLAGFPADRPWDVSPDGWVSADDHSYRLDDVNSVRQFTAPPPGFTAATGVRSRINDHGDLVVFLGTTVSDPLYYLHRYTAATGAWQLLSGSPNGNLSNWGIGSIDSGATVVATVTSTAVRAQGPGGTAQSLGSQMSPAYVDAFVSTAGEEIADGRIVASVFIGRSPRLARLAPVRACVGACLRVASLVMTGVFVDDPKNPGSCTPKARNRVKARLRVTDAAGNPQAGVKIQARYLDDYDLNRPLTGRTNANGDVTLKHEGPACVGAVALLVEKASLPGWKLDRTKGVLNGQVIPLP